MGYPIPDWMKTLAIALVSSFFTVCLAEPTRTAIQRWTRKRDLRRVLYYEMVENHFALHAQVTMAKQDREMIEGIAGRFAMGFNRSCLDLVRQDPLTFYRVGFRERYWIDLIYRDMENVIHGRFEDDDQRFRAAEFAASSLLTYMKNRMLSKRLIYKICKPSFRADLREQVHKAPYIDMNPPTVLERFKRRFD